MSHVHICLVSDQTIPNILGIYHFKPDTVFFITTKEMEKREKTTAIVETLKGMGLNFEGRYKKIIVAEDSILDCHRKIDESVQDVQDSEFSVNLTNGTKIMSIAAYDYFKDYVSKMIYIPINKNEFISPFPKKAHTKPETLDLRLMVNEYLAAYGLNVSNHKKLKRYGDEALERKDLSRWIASNYSKVKNLLVVLGGALRNHRDDSKDYMLKIDFNGATPSDKELIQRLGMSYSDDTISKLMTRSEIRYITGGWLEEFCFCELHHYLNNGIDDIKTGLKLKNRKGNENEFDVMFTMDNALYFVECKTLEQQNLDYKDILYKIGALQQDFGLRVNSFWVTTSSGIMKNDELKPAVEARAAQFNTVIVPPKDVPDFGKIVAKKLKLENHNNIKIEQ